MPNLPKTRNKMSFKSKDRSYKFVFGRLKRENVETAIISSPDGRSGHRIVACEKNIYAYGGYNPEIDDDDLDVPDVVRLPRVLFLEIWCFNMATRMWKRVANWETPSEVASTTVRKFGNTMLVHGGTGFPFGINNISSTYVKRLQNGNLTQLETTGDIPLGAYGQASAIDEENKIFYVVGGSTTGYTFSMDVHSLNLRTNKWTKLSNGTPDDIPSRYRHEIALYNNKIIVFGGGTLEDSFGFDILPVFDLCERSWSTMHPEGFMKTSSSSPKFPMARRCHSGVLVPADEYHDAYYVICGGSSRIRGFNDVWSLNLRTEQWSKWSTTLPHNLHFHDATLTPQGQMVIFGGVVSNNRLENVQFRTNAVFTCWVTIPKLSDIAWEALQFYKPELLKMSLGELRRYGIPLSIASRVKM